MATQFRGRCEADDAARDDLSRRGRSYRNVAVIATNANPW